LFRSAPIPIIDPISIRFARRHLSMLESPVEKRYSELFDATVLKTACGSRAAVLGEVQRPVAFSEPRIPSAF